MSNYIIIIDCTTERGYQITSHFQAGEYTLKNIQDTLKTIGECKLNLEALLKRDLNFKEFFRFVLDFNMSAQEDSEWITFLEAQEILNFEDNYLPYVEDDPIVEIEEFQYHKLAND